MNRPNRGFLIFVHFAVLLIPLISIIVVVLTSDLYCREEVGDVLSMLSFSALCISTCLRSGFNKLGPHDTLDALWIILFFLGVVSLLVMCFIVHLVYAF